MQTEVDVTWPDADVTWPEVDVTRTEVDVTLSELGRLCRSLDVTLSELEVSGRRFEGRPSKVSAHNER